MSEDQKRDGDKSGEPSREPGWVNEDLNAWLSHDEAMHRFRSEGDIKAAGYRREGK